jgi:hypothetical protein
LALFDFACILVAYDKIVLNFEPLLRRVIMENDRNDDMTIPSPEVPGEPNVYNPRPQNVIDVPSMQEAPRYESAPSYGEPVVNGPASYQGALSEEPPKKSNKKTIWIIVIVVVLLLCCCCIAIVLAVSSMMQDTNIQDWEDLLDEFSFLLQVAPGYAQAYLAL